MKTIPCRQTHFAFLAILVLGLGIPAQTVFAAPRAVEEFPQKNAWTRVTPSVVWCGDTESKVTIEVHIVERTDVRKVWVTHLGQPEEDYNLRTELLDDGTHGDAKAGDNVFTLGNVILPCNPGNVQGDGWSKWWGFLRVELADGTQQESNAGIVAGLVDSKYKKIFAVHDFGNNLSATAYSFFIVDSDHKVMDNYPVASVYCGTTNVNAYRKLYSALPDAFDFALVTPGMLIVRPDGLAENVPYEVSVSNNVEHINLDIFDNTAAFGSAGRLKSVIYHSFGDIAIATHEMGHAWGMHIGASLGLMESSEGEVMLGHWNEMTDIGGKMSAYYFDDAGHVGHFRYNGDETWQLIANTVVEPYAALDLYAMGMIPAEEVPPIHILKSPNFNDLSRITVASFQTVTMDQILQAEGGPRVPSVAESQKDFTLAYIVTQDTTYNDAAYAYFSLMSYNLMSKSFNARTYFASFNWATGGRGTLNTRLPVDVADPAILPRMTTETDVPTNRPPLPYATETATSTKPASGSPFCNFPLLVGGLTILPGAWVAMRRRRTRM
jgi:hypothetical protein